MQWKDGERAREKNGNEEEEEKSENPISAP